MSELISKAQQNSSFFESHFWKVLIRKQTVFIRRWFLAFLIFQMDLDYNSEVSKALVIFPGSVLKSSRFTYNLREIKFSVYHSSVSQTIWWILEEDAHCLKGTLRFSIPLVLRM